MREHQIVITLKPEQFLLVQKLARNAGAKSMGMFVRQQLLAALGIEGQGKNAGAEPDLEPVVSELKRLHNELREIVAESLVAYSDEFAFSEESDAVSMEVQAEGLPFSVEDPHPASLADDELEQTAGRTFAISPRLGPVETADPLSAASGLAQQDANGPAFVQDFTETRSGSVFGVPLNARAGMRSSFVEPEPVQSHSDSRFTNIGSSFDLESSDPEAGSDDAAFDEPDSENEIMDPVADVTDPGSEAMDPGSEAMDPVSESSYEYEPEASNQDSGLVDSIDSPAVEEAFVAAPQYERPAQPSQFDLPVQQTAINQTSQQGFFDSEPASSGLDEESVEGEESKPLSTLPANTSWTIPAMSADDFLKSAGVYSLDVSNQQARDPLTELLGPDIALPAKDSSSVPSVAEDDDAYDVPLSILTRRQQMAAQLRAAQDKPDLSNNDATRDKVPEKPASAVPPPKPDKPALREESKDQKPMTPPPAKEPKPQPSQGASSFLANYRPLENPDEDSPFSGGPPPKRP